MTFRFRKCQMKTTKLFLFSLATVLYNHAATSVSCTRSTLSPWRNLHYCSTHFSDCKICMIHSIQHGEETNNHWSSYDAFLKPPQPLTDKFIIVLHSCHISPLIFNCHSLTSLYCPPSDRQNTAHNLQGDKAFHLNNHPVEHLFFLPQCWRKVRDDSETFQQRHDLVWRKSFGCCDGRFEDRLWQDPYVSQRSTVICSHSGCHMRGCVLWITLSCVRRFVCVHVKAGEEHSQAFPLSSQIRTSPKEYGHSWNTTTLLHHSGGLFCSKGTWFTSVCF